MLTLTGEWELNDRHEIVYTYSRKQLKTKTTDVQELVFKGYWDIPGSYRLTYYVGGDSNNAFAFKGAFETVSVRAKEGELRYQIGVQVKGQRRLKTIGLFGRWKVSKDLSLDFEYDCGEAKRTITFGGEYQLRDDRTVAVNLKHTSGKGLGVELILQQDIFGKDGQSFVRLQKSLEDTRVEAGMKFRW